MPSCSIKWLYNCGYMYYGVGDQFLLSIDGYNSGRQSNGVAYWRVLDSANNQRSPNAWEGFMKDSQRLK